MSQRQKHGESGRTHTERNGPNQRSFTPNEPRLAEGRPRSHKRRTTQISRCDLAWSPRRTGGPGLSHWRCTGHRLPEHQRERARAVSKSPAESAAEDAGPSGRSEPRRDLPSQPVCRSPTRSSPTPGCDFLRQQLRGLSGLSAKAERCEADACRE